MTRETLDTLTLQLERLTPAAASHNPRVRALAEMALDALSLVHGLRPELTKAVFSQILLEKGANTGVPAPAAASPKAESGPRKIDQDGPALWAEIHSRARAWTGGDDFDFLTAMTGRLPCGECRNNWAIKLAMNPPRFALPGWSYFAWTVERHNEVRKAQGKPQLSLAEAEALYPLPS